MAELATDYLEGDLPWHRRLQAWLHLLACRACQAYFQQLRKTVSLLRGLPPAAVPDSMVDEVVRNAKPRQMP